MRALSVRQPWAELIARGKKKVEYRSWAREFRGDLLIVASASRHDDECRDERLDPEKLAYGQAVCVVDFWKVTGDEGDYEWHLRNPRRVEPFAVKGYASIYQVNDALIRCVDGSALAASPEPVAPRAPSVRRSRRREEAIPALIHVDDVVLVESDPQRLADLSAKVTRILGREPTCFDDGKVAWRHIQRTCPPTIVASTMLEGLSGLELLQRVRRNALLGDSRFVLLDDTGAAKSLVVQPDAILAREPKPKELTSRPRARVDP